MYLHGWLPLSVLLCFSDLSNYTNFKEIGKDNLCDNNNETYEDMCVGGITKTQMYYIFLVRYLHEYIYIYYIHMHIIHVPVSIYILCLMSFTSVITCVFISV